MTEVIDNFGGILNANLEEAHQQGVSGNLTDYCFCPARVIVNKDDQNHGRIKVVAPGVMDASNNDVSSLPWVWPFMMPGIGNSSYSLLRIGAFVWLFYNKNNNNEFWYIPGYEQHNLAQEFIDVNGSVSEGTDVISCRDNGTSSSSVTSTASGGVNVSSGGASTVTNGGTASQTNSSGAGVRSVGSNTDIGGGGAGEPAVLGGHLVEFLGLMIDALQLLVESLKEDPFMPPGALELVATTFDILKLVLKSEDILSPNVSLSEELSNQEALNKRNETVAEIKEKYSTSAVQKWNASVSEFATKNGFIVYPDGPGQKGAYLTERGKAYLEATGSDSFPG